MDCYTSLNLVQIVDLFYPNNIHRIISRVTQPKVILLSAYIRNLRFLRMELWLTMVNYRVTCSIVIVYLIEFSLILSLVIAFDIGDNLFKLSIYSLI